MGRSPCGVTTAALQALSSWAPVLFATAQLQLGRYVASMPPDGTTARAPEKVNHSILASWCNMRAYEAHCEKPATGERKQSEFGRVGIKGHPLISLVRRTHTVIQWHLLPHLKSTLHTPPLPIV